MKLLWITLICILWVIVCGNVRNEDDREIHLTEIGVCFNKDSNGRKQTFCCKNHENIEGKCKKCDIGYTSPAGKACRPCPNDLYGVDCNSVCKCTIDKRCDHVIGCVLNIMSPTYQGTYFTYMHNGTEQGTEYLSPSWHRESTTPEIKINIPSVGKGIIRYNLIYVSCTGGLTIGIVCFTLWRNHRKKCCNSDTDTSHTENAHIDANELHQTSIPQYRIQSDSVYDEIDDIESTLNNMVIRNDGHRGNDEDLDDDNPSIPLRTETVYDEVDENSLSADRIDSVSVQENLQVDL